MSTDQPSRIQSEVRRRRTFAIISHPDAGKTTLTEKLLLFSGAIQIAGAVKSRKTARHATSDWMEIEKQRGISVASSVMQMEYRDCVINLLDTPIVTFINKMDRDVRAPLELIDEIERELGMAAAPFTWPIGMGKQFKGVL